MKKKILLLILSLITQVSFANILEKDFTIFVNGGAGFAFGDNITWEKNNFTLTETFTSGSTTFTRTDHPSHYNLFFGFNFEILLLKNESVAFGPRLSIQKLYTKQRTTNNGEKDGVKYEGGATYDDVYLNVTPILVGGVLYTGIGLYLVGQFGLLSGEIHPLANKTNGLINDNVSGNCYNLGIGYAGTINSFYWGIEMSYEGLNIKTDKFNYPFGNSFTQHNINFSLSIGLAI